MSIREEQYRALKSTRDFIYDIFSVDKYPKTKKEMRERGRRVIKHFPPLEKSGKPIFSKDTITKD